MKSGLEFELSNGIIIQVVPTQGAAICSVSHGDTRIDIKPSDGTFRIVAPFGKLLAEIPHVVRFEPKDLVVTNPQPAEQATGAAHAMKSCTTCGGRWCCVSGGCVNCGCGWTCGAEP
ncbi:hypothetical protein [Aromatoleum diolicum]|uniref:Uncharacterized protein n=1 Tax=Aromatoleum diolicum TaxID=75796 RepID=A0ABX1QFM7_9RHOO|nr:hypothetical protein [Aromatoleum diolicum]NMG77243.1 hypothetical protein [Aromatoleum diolicum]